MSGTRITSMKLVNDYDPSMIITAADDGVVRIWRGYTSNETLKMDWKGDSGLVLVSGETPDSPKIRICDVERELGVQDIFMANEKRGPLFSAGFSDGLVKLFDQRIPEKYRCVSTLT
ncbi:hypothetical protein RB653_009191 [Dictyostelium firmibasis]|uniref:Uncharacterized protein n=1 Tax=Dictyostelium firmibasis TaxID=79012 RepID=A0AAN7U0K5_9MYCE